MTRTRNMSDLLDSSGDVKSGALDNVPASDNASALTTGTLPDGRFPATLPAVSGANLTSLNPANLTGVTSTAAELNILDGVTATATELNYVDGVTSAIQTQIDNINTDLVNDTSPQLGGTLDTNGNDINFGDNDKAVFGAGNDLQIFHDGSNSHILDAGTGSLVLRSPFASIKNQTNTETMASFSANGAVNLFYDNAKKLETTSTGVDVTGVITTDGMTTSADINFGDNDKAVFGAGNDLQIYHNGSHSRIEDSGTGKLQLGSDTEVEILKSGFAESMAKFIPDGAVELYHNNSKKLETTSTGVDVTGDVLADTVTLDNGSNDWQFSVSGNNLIISYGGTSKAKLDSSGNLTVVGDVTAFGTI